jgi:hypothetical protein
MDNRSGFKECSRCGLRNKPSAKQCDFCGQKFEVADEWELQVDALERLNRETKRVEVTENVSKRIEATIIRKEISETKQEPVIKGSFRESPEKAPIVDSSPEPKIEQAPEPKEQTTVITFTATETKLVEVEKERTAPEEAPTVKIEETSTVEKTVPVTEAVPSPFETELLKVENHKVQKETFKHRKCTDKKIFGWNFNMKDRKSVFFMLVLILGIVLYIASIAMSSSIGTIESWSVVAFSGFMIVVGIAQIAIDWNPTRYREDVFEHHEIVIICPNCNEKVSEDDERCPSCGTEFEQSNP